MFDERGYDWKGARIAGGVVKSIKNETADLISRWA